MALIDKICAEHPPVGVFYIIKLHGKLAGMGGLRQLSSTQVEIKRIYVRPECRGFQLGERMLKRLLKDATNFGYQQALLDTGSFILDSAVKPHKNNVEAYNTGVSKLF